MTDIDQARSAIDALNLVHALDHDLHATIQRVDTLLDRAKGHVAEDVRVELIRAHALIKGTRVLLVPILNQLRALITQGCADTAEETERHAHYGDKRTTRTLAQSHGARNR